MYLIVSVVRLRSPRGKNLSVLVSMTGWEHDPVCIFSLQMQKQKRKLPVIVIPVKVADKQPSPKKPLPHNEMWNIIRRVGTRQFQNPPSDVGFFLPLCFSSCFCFIHRPPPPPCLSLSVCQTLFPWHGCSSNTSGTEGYSLLRLFLTRQKKRILECMDDIFFCPSSPHKIWCCCCYALPRLGWEDLIFFW